MTQILRITFKMPNLNDWVGAMNTNRYKGGKMKKDNERLVWLTIKSQKLKRVQNPVHISYEWHEANKRRDKDNVSAFGRKVINDALQTAGVLPNDNNVWVQGITETWVYGKDYGCIVTITEIERSNNDNKRKIEKSAEIKCRDTPINGY